MGSIKDDALYDLVADHFCSNCDERVDEDKWYTCPQCGCRFTAIVPDEYAVVSLNCPLCGSLVEEVCAMSARMNPELLKQLVEEIVKVIKTVHENSQWKFSHIEAERYSVVLVFTSKDLPVG